MFGWNGLPVWSLRDTPGNALIMASTKLGDIAWSKSEDGIVWTFAGILLRSSSEPGIGVMPMTSIGGKVTGCCADARAAIATIALAPAIKATMSLQTRYLTPTI